MGCKMVYKSALPIHPRSSAQIHRKVNHTEAAATDRAPRRIPRLFCNDSLQQRWRTQPPPCMQSQPASRAWAAVSAIARRRWWAMPRM